MGTSEARRVLLLISCYSGANTGRGGHYYSVRDLARSMSSTWKTTSVEILVIGDLFPSPLRDPGLAVTYIDFSGKSLGSLVREVLTFGDRASPTHVHSFDNKSHLFGRWIARRSGAKNYLTKAGGPNPKMFFPFAPHVICFSEENLRHLSSRRNLRSARFDLLPQRVARPSRDPIRVRALRTMVGDGDVILRICRIGRFYAQSMKQTLALAKTMRDRGLDVCAVIIGVIEDEDTLSEIRACAAPEDLIITDPHFTSNAAELIELAQAVVGTGRGLVEAALIDTVVLTPHSQADLPVLVTPANWRQLAVTNFSERNQLADSTPTVDEAIAAITSRDTGGARAVAAEMGIDAAISRYDAIYREPQEQHWRSADFLVNSAAVIVRFVHSRYGRSRQTSRSKTDQSPPQHAVD